MATLIQELSELTLAFEKHSTEYAVCDGLAMATHGFARATLDIDLLIRPESLETAYEIGAAHGYDIRGLDTSFKERDIEIHRISKVDDDGEILSLDLLLVTPQVEDVWSGKEKIDFRGHELAVVSR